jgi:tRNA (mo5U34)-methyltransferase
MRQPSGDEARSFLADANFVWYQRFDLAPGVSTPGHSLTVELLPMLDLPDTLSGWRVLDVGTTNGGVAFALEARGAEVVAVDIVPPEHFGFAAIAKFLDSRATYLRASVYELPEKLEGEFDLVVLSGVLYHLRHPLLALDQIRRLCRGQLLIETAVCDYELPPTVQGPYARFYRRDELAGDGSNWFAPTTACFLDWLGSAGFDVSWSLSAPEGAPTRATAVARRSDGLPEYRRIGYEWPVVGVVLDADPIA